MRSLLLFACCALVLVPWRPALGKTSERGSRDGGELASTANNNPAALSKPATGVASRPPHFGINNYVGFDPPSGGWQVPRLTRLPSPEEFLNDYLLARKPVLIAPTTTTGADRAIWRSARRSTAWAGT